MGGYDYDYSQHQFHPELVSICTNCQSSDCTGICDNYRNAFRRIDSGGTLKRRTEKREETRLGDYKQLFEAFGEKHTISEWGKITGLGYRLIYNRICRYGMSMEEALTKPKRNACDAMLFVEVDGERMTVRQAAQAKGMTTSGIYSRIYRANRRKDRANLLEERQDERDKNR